MVCLSFNSVLSPHLPKTKQNGRGSTKGKVENGKIQANNGFCKGYFMYKKMICCENKCPGKNGYRTAFRGKS